MTTKKTTKPATKPAAAFDAIKAGTLIGEQLVQAAAAVSVLGDATVKIDGLCKAMRAAKVTLGKSRRTCPVSAAIYDGMGNLKDGTKANYLSAIRAAVNEGKGFKFPNGSDKKAGKKTGAKAGGSGAIMIALAAGDTPEAAAAKLRKGFEKMRAANEGLASLASFLVDALDDAGFPAGETETE
jgi:hypothetical protein